MQTNNFHSKPLWTKEELNAWWESLPTDLKQQVARVGRLAAESGESVTLAFSRARVELEGVPRRSMGILDWANKIVHIQCQRQEASILNKLAHGAIDVRVINK